MAGHESRAPKRFAAGAGVAALSAAALALGFGFRAPRVLAQQAPARAVASTRSPAAQAAVRQGPAVPAVARLASAAPSASALPSASANASALPDAGDGGVALFPRNRQGAAPEGVRSPRCPPGMLLVEGEYCPQVEQNCLRWLDPDAEFPMRCAEFEPTRCIGRRRPMSFCIDEYEAPNERGAFPQVMLTWYQARRACESRGARLCSMAEWTFACEGPEMLPYPYGYQRDRDACHLDAQTRRPDRARLGNPFTAADESARLYEAAASGAYDRCVSPFGVHDMTGNVDEWTVNETGRPYNSGLKGGWWGPIRGRCRPATISHNETFIYYQIGYRCCADLRPTGPAGAAPAGASAAPAGPSAARR